MSFIEDSEGWWMSFSSFKPKTCKTWQDCPVDITLERVTVLLAIFLHAAVFLSTAFPVVTVFPFISEILLPSPCWTLWVQDIICSSVLVGAIGLAMCWDVGTSHGWLEHIETLKSCKIKSCGLLLPYGRLFFCFQDENLNFKQNFEDLVKARPPESGRGILVGLWDWIAQSHGFPVPNDDEIDKWRIGDFHHFKLKR